MTVRYHPSASAELDAHVLWYDDEQPGLGAAFLGEVRAAEDAIADAPQTWSIVSKRRRIRRFLLTRFPFSLIFVANGDEILILAVAHTKRRPFYWRGRQPSS